VGACLTRGGSKLSQDADELVKLLFGDCGVEPDGELVLKDGGGSVQ
jgi:hypothetical protein